MGTIGYNMREDVQRLRDAYFSKGMKEYYEQLMSDENEVEQAIKYVRRLTENCRTTDQIVDKLYNHAKGMMNKIECGEVEEKDLEETEKRIAHCLYCIIDTQLVLVREKSYDCDERGLE